MIRHGLAGFVCWIALHAPALGALVLNDLTGYSTSFDTPFLQSFGTANPWVDNAVGHVGWYWQNIYPSLTYDAGTPNMASFVAAYSFGADTDRAMGNFGGPAGDANHPNNPHTAWGIVFKNNTTQTITGVSVAYTGEQWRRGDLVDSLRFSYKTSAQDVTSLDPTGGAAPNGWTSHASLNFSATLTGTPRLAGTPLLTPLSSTLPATVLPGEYLALRWYDADDGGSVADAAMGIDDLSVGFLVTAVPEASALLFACAAVGVAGAVSVVKARRGNRRG